MFDHRSSVKSRNTGTSIYDRLKPYCETSSASSYGTPSGQDLRRCVSSHHCARHPIKARSAAFYLAGMCAVNRYSKVPPIRKYNAALSPDTISYVGIASDEPQRLARLEGTNKVSCLISTAIRR
jgi:hypothetical protein